MKKNSFYVILFFIFLLPLYANEPLISKKKAPLSVALPLLEKIDKHAIVIGNGPTHMYAFIDPLCPRSQEFVEMILENRKMQKLYTYHFFYYELKRFDSAKIIGTIYSQNDPLKMMKKVMVDKREFTVLDNFSTMINKKVSEISKIAEKLDIYKRPYIFVVKPQKGGQ